ncbi:hypothetical protein KIPB_014627, partial [Kipferlia bialata]|eukprot:g14627.t1
MFGAMFLNASSWHKGVVEGVPRIPFGQSLAALSESSATRSRKCSGHPYI